MKKTKQYDLIVIGSGAGAKIARPAAEKGKNVAIIEQGKLGGTCLNRGCIPSKMLIYPSDVATKIKEAKKYHLKAEFKETQFTQLLQEINKKTDTNSNGIKTWYESKKIKHLTYYNGKAHFIDNKTIEVNGNIISGKQIIIATGAKPFIPPIEGLNKTPYWTSTEALRARKLPKKLVILGGGYIGVELGHAYSALGSKVEYLVRDGLLPRVDSQIRERFVKEFEKNKKIHYNTTTTKVTYSKSTKKFTITYTQENKTKTITCDAFLVATGVIPNTDELGLENTKIKQDKRGFIKVNSFLETSVKGVYALGDCIGTYLFRHAANFQAEYLFEQLFKTKKSKISYPPMPWAIFTHPQIAGVGPSEDELRAKGNDILVGEAEYSHCAMGNAMKSEEGLVKILFDKKTKRILASHIIGEQASTLIHMMIILITQKAKLDDMFKYIYIHPALPEVVRNAARDARSKF
jgi:dihydrolipoamide dehydrogenase